MGKVLDSEQSMGRPRVNDTREKVLDFARDFLRSRRFPAPIRTIAAGIKRDAATVHEHLRKLVESGEMEQDEGRYIPRAETVEKMPQAKAPGLARQCWHAVARIFGMDDPPPPAVAVGGAA